MTEVVLSSSSHLSNVLSTYYVQGMVLDSRNKVVNNIYLGEASRPVGETVSSQMDKHVKAITSQDKCREEKQQGVEIEKPGNTDFSLGRSEKAFLREWDSRREKEAPAT